ncbi:MAG: TolC family protein [Syntrophorhabdaceae bacterium]|nr:TolC family protein [Syntrophorhabdaceae bacterium]
MINHGVNHRSVLYMVIKIWLLTSFFALSLPRYGLSITLEDAVKRVLDVSYVLKEQQETIKRTEFSYLSTIDPYLPQANLQSSYTRYLNPRLSTGGLITGQDVFSTSGSISLRLFDGGLRSAQRMGSYHLMGREKEKLESLKNDIVYNVKTAFFTALGKKTIVEKRKEAYETAKRVFELTKARFEVGVAKKSDVLQAEVGMTSAMIDVVSATSDYEKALEDLKSLLLLEPEAKEEVEGILSEPTFTEGYERLIDRALKARPDVSYQMREIERLKTVYNEKRSLWFPKIDAQILQQRQDSSMFPEGRQDMFMLNFTLPIFDGIGRYYSMQGATSDVNAAKFRLEEIKRNIKLEIIKAYKDYLLTIENVKMYNELLKQATTNFEQAVGEYRVGKGDILALLQAERELAKAKENLVVSMYTSNNALAYLQKVSYWNGDLR